MHRELNPELFGEGTSSRSHRPDSGASASGGPSETATHSGLDRQVHELRLAMAAMAEEMRKVSLQVQEFMKTSHLRMERLQQQVLRIEQSHNGMAQEVGQKFHTLGLRLGERKTLDQKTQELMDRHGQIVKSFEVRMNHLQRLLSEKESQFMNAQAALNEMKMELSRLKRL